MPGCEASGNTGDGFKEARLRHPGCGVGENVGGSVKVGGLPEFDRALDFADGQTGPRVLLVMNAFLAVESDANAAFITLLTAYVAEVVKQFDGREDERGAHGFGAASVVDDDVPGGDSPFFQKAGNEAAEGGITGTELLEAVYFKELRSG